MKARIFEQWCYWNPAATIERQFAQSARATNRQTNEPEAKPSKREPQQRSYHLTMVANQHFKPRTDIKAKVPTRIIERRKAAFAAAANDQMLRKRKAQ